MGGLTPIEAEVVTGSELQEHARIHRTCIRSSGGVRTAAGISGGPQLSLTTEPPEHNPPAGGLGAWGLGAGPWEPGGGAETPLRPWSSAPADGHPRTSGGEGRGAGGHAPFKYFKCSVLFYSLWDGTFGRVKKLLNEM